jgi:hypothetical protein
MQGFHCLCLIYNDGGEGDCKDGGGEISSFMREEGGGKDVDVNLPPAKYFQLSS